MISADREDFDPNGHSNPIWALRFEDLVAILSRAREGKFSKIMAFTGNPAETPSRFVRAEAGAPSRPRVLLAGIALALAGFSQAAAAFEWELVKYQGRDYVTKESVHEFYRFQNLRSEGNTVRFLAPTLEMKAIEGKQDLYINNVRFILSYPVIRYNGRTLFSRLDLAKVIDPVLRPSYIRTANPFRTVVIDPGHGGHDPGARGVLGREKDYALKLGLELRESLVKRGYTVRMTRSDDRFLSLDQRVRFANDTADSIFISLHYNSGQRDAHGIETYALSPQGTSSTHKRARASDGQFLSGNKLDSENIALATAVHASVLHKIPAVDRGIKRARWTVLTGIKRPAILFEGGFITNSGECRKVSTESHRKEMAEAIAAAVSNFRAAMQGK
jgi:N-acetylmuramoyl-L-alanine amidase